jgi:carbonic anhydrase
MAHHCKNAIVHCIDFRLQKALKNYMEGNGLLGDCDVVSAAGGVKNREFMMEQIALSKNLHGIERVILINHTDCGAYGGGDETLHNGELKSAGAMVLEKHPDLKVKLLLAKINGAEVIFQEIQ